MKQKRDNFSLDYEARVLADSNSKYSLAKRVIELQDEVEELKQGLEKDNEVSIEPCTCGQVVSDESTLIDSLYPQNRERTEWVFGCMVHNGGCGRQVYAEDKQTVVNRWNNGDVDEYLRD